MARAIILVMDSFGIGATKDADKFGDIGADTFGHIWQSCVQGEADKPGLRQGPLQIPNLLKLGLGEAAKGSTGTDYPSPPSISGAYGFAVEISSGKDTPSGHWEMAGLPVTFDWGLFPKTEPCFPNDFIDEWAKKCNLPGILGNKHASGTSIIEELGNEHVKSGKPICYTSADSVFQIAAHETSFGLDRLYEICETAKEMLEPLNIGRVIARPFVGDGPDSFTRTANRRDYTTLPHEDTLLDVLKKSGGEVVSIGKISDIFAHQGVTKKIKASCNMDLFDSTLAEINNAGDNSLIFTNFVDFDMLFGHRRDVAGYANALEEFDKRLPELITQLKSDDLVLITADHGCDPTWQGSDHTREHVPVLFFGPNIPINNLGQRASFADMGQTIASHLNLPTLNYGVDCFDE